MLHKMRLMKCGHASNTIINNVLIDGKKMDLEGCGYCYDNGNSNSIYLDRIIPVANNNEDMNKFFTKSAALMFLFIISCIMIGIFFNIK